MSPSASSVGRVKMKAKMAEGSEYFSIGSIVACKTCYQREIEGEVLAFDPQTKMLVLKCPSSNNKPLLNDINVINLGMVGEVIVKEEVGGSGSPTASSAENPQSAGGGANSPAGGSTSPTGSSGGVGPPSQAPTNASTPPGGTPTPSASSPASSTMPSSINLQRLNTKARNAVEEKRRYVSALSSGVSGEGQSLFLAITKTIDEVTWHGPNIVVMNQVTITPPYKTENVKSACVDSKALNHVRKIVEKHMKDFALGETNVGQLVSQ